MTNVYEQGYDNFLTKPLYFDTEIVSEESQVVNAFTDPVAPAAIQSGELAGNLNVVQGYLQSSNFVSGVNGWKFDALGNLEANSGTFRGSIYAATGLIGGWALEAGGISQANAFLGSTGYLSFGETPPTEYGNNVGVWLGYSSGSKVSLYSDTNNYLQWNGSVLTVKGANFELDASGNITANGGTIGGFTITNNTLYGSTIKTAATVSAGSNGVIMDEDGLRGYDSVLGNTFNLPTDGSAPTFSSGIINNTIFEIQTNAVLRTSETVGDGSADSEGVLINNTGFYGCVEDQTLASANIRILNTGTMFAGNTDNYFFWDGTYARIKGNLELTSIFNNISYAVVNLPIQPTTEGFLSPTAYEY